MHWFGTCLTIVILSPLSLISQQSGLSSPLSRAARQEGRDIVIEVTVTDKSGKPVRGLQQQNFTILDDKRVKTPTAFWAVDQDVESTPPVEMVLVIDAINGTVLQAGRQREGIRRFLESNEGKLPLMVSVMAVTDKGITKRLSASSEGKALAAALDQTATGLRVVNRSTNYNEYDRFRLSLDALNAAIAREDGKPGKKVIVWISPGWPTLTRIAGSDITRTNQEHLFNAIVTTSTALRLNHITLYQVVSHGVGIKNTDASEFAFYSQFLQGVRSISQAYPNGLALPVLAVQSGGLVLNGSNDRPEAIAQEIAKIAADTRAFYFMTFPPSQTDRTGQFHTLQVLVDQQGLTARTRSGYYALP